MDAMFFFLLEIRKYGHLWRTTTMTAMTTGSPSSPPQRTQSVVLALPTPQRRPYWCFSKQWSSYHHHYSLFLEESRSVLRVCRHTHISEFRGNTTWHPRCRLEPSLSSLLSLSSLSALDVGEINIASTLSSPSYCDVVFGNFDNPAPRSRGREGGRR